MKNVRSIELNEANREERLPDFDPAFPYIATRAELDAYAEPAVPWHWHREVELFLVESGAVEYTTSGGRWLFPAGSGGFLNSGVLHTTRLPSRREKNTQLLHLFDPALISGGVGSRMEQKYILPLSTAGGLERIPLFPDDPVQAAILAKMQAAFLLQSDQWGYELILRGALAEIWMDILGLAQPQIQQNRRRSSETEGQIKAMMVYVQEHFSEEITVEQLAEAGRVSRRACFRLFREKLHMTPLEYLRGCRLRQACRLLRETEGSVTEIAAACGLGSASYFGQVFLKQFDCTPLQYRRNWHDRDIN